MRCPWSHVRAGGRAGKDNQVGRVDILNLLLKDGVEALPQLFDEHSDLRRGLQRKPAVNYDPICLVLHPELPSEQQQAVRLDRCCVSKVHL